MQNDIIQYIYSKIFCNDSEILDSNSSRYAHIAVSFTFLLFTVTTSTIVSSFLIIVIIIEALATPISSNLPTSSGFPLFPIQSGSHVLSFQLLFFGHSLLLCSSDLPLFLFYPLFHFPFNLIFLCPLLSSGLQASLLLTL